MQFWEPVGHAILTDDYIRLVPDQQSKSGGIWNSLVSYMWFSKGIPWYRLNVAAIYLYLIIISNSMILSAVIKKITSHKKKRHQNHTHVHKNEVWFYAFSFWRVICLLIQRINCLIPGSSSGRENSSVKNNSYFSAKSQLNFYNFLYLMITFFITPTSILPLFYIILNRIDQNKDKDDLNVSICCKILFLTEIKAIRLYSKYYSLCHTFLLLWF